MFSFWRLSSLYEARPNAWPLPWLREDWQELSRRRWKAAWLGRELPVFWVQCACFGFSSSFNSLVWVLHPNLDTCTMTFLSARNFSVLETLVGPWVCKCSVCIKLCYISIAGYVVYSLLGNKLSLLVSPSGRPFPGCVMGSGVLVGDECWASQRQQYNEC